jgi:hypothetical protein
MNTYLKANCVALYLLAIGAMFTELPWGSGPYLQRLALALVAVHAIETVVAFKHVKAYRGPLGASIALSLLYGLLHWWPLAKRHNASTPTETIHKTP